MNSMYVAGAVEKNQMGEVLTVSKTAGENGSAVANFVVNTGHAYIRTTVFGHTVEFLQKNLHDGDYVVARGSLRTSQRDGKSYTDFVADSYNGVELCYENPVKMNIVMLRGRLCADAEAHEKSTTARIAVQRPRRGDNTDTADFFSVVAFGDDDRRNLANYKKGDYIAIVGHENISSYERDGEKRRSVSIVIDELLSDNKEAAPEPAAPTPTPVPQPKAASVDEMPADDDLPFEFN